MSLVESIARRTSAIYALLGENKIDSMPPWTGADGQGKEQLVGVSLSGRSGEGFNADWWCIG
jgi:hypothetical protein